MAIDWTLTFDAKDPRQLADFWALALGYVDEAGYAFEDGVSLVDPQGRGPAISFLRVPEAKIAKNRCHLDVRPTTGMADPVVRDEVIRAKVADLAAAGATVMKEVPIGNLLEWVVMADPEGNELCVASPSGCVCALFQNWHLGPRSGEGSAFASSARRLVSAIRTTGYIATPLCRIEGP